MSLSPIASLINLQLLSCSFTKVKNLSAITRLLNLQVLHCRGTQISDLKPLTSLTNLRELSAGNTQILDLTPLTNLTELQDLYFHTTQVRNLKPLVGLTKLRILSTFKTSVVDLTPLTNLTELQELYCNETQVSELTPLAGLTKLRKLAAYKTSVVDLTPLTNLTELQELYCNENQVSELTPLAGLTKLRILYAYKTSVVDLTPLANLTELQELYCYQTQVSSLSPLSKLFNLKKLDSSDTSISDLASISWGKFDQLDHLCLSNTHISNLSPLLPLIKRGMEVKWRFWDSEKGIYLWSLPLIDPPEQVVKQGNEAILRYFDEKGKQGEVKLYEAKIVVVGAGESGKTTLIKKLLNPAHPVPNPEDKRTEGIRVWSYPITGNVAGESKALQAHLWDFGGQELYHTTHQLFLTADTLYILLNDNRKNDTDFYYWLNIVTLRASQKCPILMVFNAKDNAPRQIIPSEELFNAFGNLLPEAIDVNFADTDNGPVYRMKTLVDRHFSQLDVLGKSFPAYWVQVREALTKLPNEHISWTRFTEICEVCQVKDVHQMRILAQTLHNLGALLYFADVFGLEDLVILKPQWCIDAIYGALDIPEINKNDGRFNEVMLASKWSGSRFSGNRLQLLKLMQSFDLCYPIEGSNDYIAPQLLPIDERRDPTFSGQGAIVHRFNYTFMPAGILTRLIARLSRFIKTPYVWRTGVTLQWDEGTTAEVIENQFSRQIVMRVVGPERKRRLAEIRKTLYDLHANFRGLKFKELVACNCADCINNSSATTFELTSLEDDAFHNDEVKCTNGKRKKIPAREILEGIDYVDKPRIFISYSHKNEGLKNEFRTMISPLEREGHWKVWDDRWLLAGDNWNHEILRHLAEANVIVLMITADFFNSDYIYDIEMSRAIQRHESGDALVVGVIIDHCLWEETPLQRIQMLPADGKPVQDNPNRNEVWKTVANKIKEAIAVREGKQKRQGGWHDTIGRQPNQYGLEVIQPIGERLE